MNELLDNIKDYLNKKTLKFGFLLDVDKIKITDKVNNRNEDGKIEDNSTVYFDYDNISYIVENLSGVIFHDSFAVVINKDNKILYFNTVIFKLTGYEYEKTNNGSCDTVKFRSRKR